MTALWSLVQRYLEARPFDWRSWDRQPTGHKLLEEVQELLEALEELYGALSYPELSPDVHSALIDHVKEEIGDVAVCLAYIAHCQDVTVEECVEFKTEKDRGRGGSAAKEVTG